MVVFSFLQLLLKILEGEFLLECEDATCAMKELCEVHGDEVNMDSKKAKSSPVLYYILKLYENFHIYFFFGFRSFLTVSTDERSDFSASAVLILCTTAPGTMKMPHTT